MKRHAFALSALLIGLLAAFSRDSGPSAAEGAARQQAADGCEQLESLRLQDR